MKSITYFASGNLTDGLKFNYDSGLSDHFYCEDNKKESYTVDIPNNCKLVGLYAKLEGELRATNLYFLCLTN